MMDARWLQDLARADFLKSAGLYVMPDRLFLVRVRKDLLRVSVLEEQAREIPVSADPAIRKQGLTEAIRSLLPHFDPAKEPLYICLSPHQAVTLELLLPRAAEDNLREVVAYEIQRQIPFRGDDLCYDFLLAGRKGDKIRVLLFAAPKRILDELLEVLASVGVRPRGFETTTTALSNYLLFCGGTLTGLSLILGGQGQGWEIIGLNVQSQGWRREQEILYSHWLPQTDWIQGPGRAVFQDSVSDSTRFFGWGYISDLLLSLGQESLQFEDLIALGKQKLGGQERIEHSFFLPALGAALRGLREAAFSANLLPGAAEEAGGRTFSWLHTCLTILLLIGLLLWGGSYPLRDELRLRQLQKENQKLVGAVEAVRAEEEQLNRLRKEVLFLSGLKERRGEIFLVLDELSRIVPEQAYLLNLRYREGAVDLQGSADTASNLVPLLERSPIFKNVAFTAPTNRGRDNKETFSLKAELERAQDGRAKP